MTLNQIIRRIKTLAEAHKQVASFFQGDIRDFLADKGRRYPAVFCQFSSGAIDISSAIAGVSLRLYFVDIVHVAAETKLNELDVQSDAFEVAKDIVAQIKNPLYTDWRVSASNTAQFISEDLDDMLAGVYLDITIETPYTQNICQVPTELTNYSPIDNDMKLVYDELYTATGTEGRFLTIPAVKGMRILFIMRDNGPLYKVSNSPTSTEYVWDLTDIELGIPTTPGNRFLILYRKS